MSDGALEDWLLGSVTSRLTDFTAQLRTADASVQVPNLEWTVADLGQHVACLPSFWRNQHQAGDHFEQPENFAAYSDQARAHITDSDPNSLADICIAEFETFLDELAEPDATRWLYGRATNAANMVGLAINELVLHGRDLAAVTGAQAPSFDRREANAAVDGIMVTTPSFIDASKASAQPDGVYHVHFRGGRDYTWTKRGPQLDIAEGRPQRADARLSADPATFLLVSLQRAGQISAALSGKMVAYGLRPWRFYGLGAIAVDGV